MAAFTSILAALGAGAAATGTVHSIVAGNNAQNEAKAQAAKAEAQQTALTEEAKKKAAEEEAKTAATLMQAKARSRQKALAQGQQGRAGTVVTSPLGIPGSGSSSSGGGKTLLGT